MKALKNTVRALLIGGLAGVTLASAADATSYNFNVLYFGAGNASLAGGSDDPLTTSLMAGDSFTYRLAAQNGVYSTTTGGDLFPFFAFPVSEAGTRVSDFTLTLSYLGNTVFSYADAAASNSYIHLGTNTVTLPGGLQFDTITLNDTIVTADTTSTPNSLLPFSGSPEFNTFPGGQVVFYNVASVPEPASWAMMLTGFGVIGGAMRSRRKAAVGFG